MIDTKLLNRLADYDNQMIAEMIDGRINGRNAERNRQILKRRLIHGVCYEPLAEEFDLSVRQTQNIVYKGVKRLLSFLC